jgi:hypothetical protein
MKIYFLGFKTKNEPDIPKNQRPPPPISLSVNYERSSHWFESGFSGLMIIV